MRSPTNRPSTRAGSTKTKANAPVPAREPVLALARAPALTLALVLTLASVLPLPANRPLPAEARETATVRQNAASSPTTATGSGANTAPEPDPIETLTDSILLKELDLERYYLRYRVLGTKEPKYRYLRYFLLQEAAAAVFLSSDLCYIGEYGSHLKDPQNESIKVLRAAPELGLIATSLEGGSSAFELGSNALIALGNVRRKMSPAAARREVIARLKEIDGLLEQRAALLAARSDAGADSACYASMKVESDILRYFRDECAFEFADVYSDIRAYQPSNNVYYFLDVASMLGYGASYVLSLQALTQPTANGPSSITGIVGDTIGIVSAPASNWSYNRFYYFWYRKLAKQMHEHFYDPQEKIKQSLARFKSCLAVDNRGTTEPASVADWKERSRLKVYDLWAMRYDKYIDDSQKELLHERKVALQSEIYGPLISSAYLTQDIMNTVGSYRYANNVKRANNIAFAATMPVITSDVMNLTVSAYWFLDEIRFSRKLKREKKRPVDLLQQRLQTLDELQSIVQMRR